MTKKPNKLMAANTFHSFSSTMILTIWILLPSHTKFSSTTDPGDSTRRRPTPDTSTSSSSRPLGDPGEDDRANGQECAAHLSAWRDFGPAGLVRVVTENYDGTRYPAGEHLQALGKFCRHLLDSSLLGLSKPPPAAFVLSSSKSAFQNMLST